MRFPSRIPFVYRPIHFGIMSLGLVFLLSFQAKAETQYVSDFLIVNIKDNLEKPYNVIGTVQSDQPVEVLEEAGRYVKVETEDGKIGWIAKQYLKDTVPKSIEIEKLQQTIKTLEEKLSSLEQYEALALNPDSIQQTVLDLEAQNSNLNNELNVLVETNQSLEEELATLRKLDVVSKENINLLEQYELSKNKIADLENKIDLQNKELIEAKEIEQQLEILKNSYDELLFTAKNSDAIAKAKRALEDKTSQDQVLIANLQKEVNTLRSNQLIYWFLAGAGVFFVGMIFGKINLKKKKRLSL